MSTFTKDRQISDPSEVVLLDDGLPVEEPEDAAQFPDADRYVEIRAMADSVGGPMGRDALIEGLGDQPTEAPVIEEELDGMAIIKPSMSPPPRSQT